MRGFTFRLDRVLRIRRAEKQQKQLALARLYGELHGVEEQKETIIRKLHENKGAQDRLLAERYRNKLEKEFALLEKREDELCAKAAMQMVELDQATAKVKTLERLREKRLARYTKKQRRKEEAESALHASQKRPMFT